MYMFIVIIIFLSREEQPASPADAFALIRALLEDESLDCNYSRINKGKHDLHL